MFIAYSVSVVEGIFFKWLDVGRFCLSSSSSATSSFFLLVGDFFLVFADFFLCLFLAFFTLK